MIWNLFGYKCSRTRCSVDSAAGFFHCCVMWCLCKHSLSFFFWLDGIKCNLYIQDLGVGFFSFFFFLKFFMNIALIVRNWNPIISLKHSEVMNCPSHSKSYLNSTACLFLLAVQSQNIVTVFFEIDLYGSAVYCYVSSIFSTVVQFRKVFVTKSEMLMWSVVLREKSKL